MSTSLSRLVAPDTSVTCRGRTPRAAASASSAACVAAPSTARALTATTSRPACTPPTTVRDAPGRTRIATRTSPSPGADEQDHADDNHRDPDQSEGPRAPLRDAPGPGPGAGAVGPGSVPVQPRDGQRQRAEAGDHAELGGP